MEANEQRYSKRFFNMANWSIFFKNSGTLYNAVKLWDNCDYRQPRIIPSDWQVLQTQRKKKTMKPETKTL